MTPARSQTRSFTLIELIVVTVITVILAALSVPVLANGSARRLSRAAHELAMHIKLARDLAVATRRTTWVDFDVAADSYSIYIEDPDTPGRPNRISATNPVTGDDFDVTLDTGEFDGVEISSAGFGGRPEVEFDRLGKPYDGVGNALASDGTAVLTAGGATRTVRVVQDTGLVKED